MKDEKKYKEEVDRQMSNQNSEIPPMPQNAQMPSIYQTPNMPEMQQMPQTAQAPYQPQYGGMPQMAMICCPYLMNMQCPMMQCANPMGQCMDYPYQGYSANNYPMNDYSMGAHGYPAGNYPMNNPHY